MKKENRENFIKAYVNIPMNARKEIILVLEEGGVKEPITWQVAYLEIKNNTPRSEKILEKLEGLKII